MVGEGIHLKRTGFTTTRKPMNKVSPKRRKKHSSSEGKAGYAYMGLVKQLPCCVPGCGAAAPSIAHHCFHGRYGSRKESDFDTIPLCAQHHDYPHKEAIHSGKLTWATKHGPDYGYIEQTRKLVGESE